MTPAEALKRFRKKFKLTQQNVADLLNISQQNYYYYESKGTLSADAVVKLADSYNVSTDYLLGRSDNPSGNKSSISEEDLKSVAEAFNQSAQALQKILEKQIVGAA